MAGRSSQYHTFLSARRLDLNDIVRPGPDADTQAWKAYRDAKLLRLVPGDDGYVLWAHGVRSFWEDIREAVRGFYETLDDTDLAGTLLAATLTDLGRTFPLVLDEEMP